jgi:hypothetical protein
MEDGEERGRREIDFVLLMERWLDSLNLTTSKSKIWNAVPSSLMKPWTNSDRHSLPKIIVRRYMDGEGLASQKARDDGPSLPS